MVHKNEVINMHCTKKINATSGITRLKCIPYTNALGWQNLSTLPGTKWQKCLSVASEQQLSSPRGDQNNSKAYVEWLFTTAPNSGHAKLWVAPSARPMLTKMMYSQTATKNKNLILVLILSHIMLSSYWCWRCRGGYESLCCGGLLCPDISSWAATSSSCFDRPVASDSSCWRYPGSTYLFKPSDSNT